MTCPHCGRAPDRWHRALALVDGVESCNYSPAWLEETKEREARVIKLLRLDDKQARRRFVASHEAYVTELRGPAVGAESRRRLEAAVLERWERVRAARNPQPTTQGAA